MPLKKSIQSGYYNLGLKLTLFDSIPNILSRITTQGNGFILKINNNSYPVSGNNQVDLLSGVQTNVDVERVYSNQLMWPYSDCLIQEQAKSNSYHSELYDLLLSL